jgi:hypothetical protein
MERARRQAAHQRAIAKAHHLISALKSVYAFDQTGNVMLAVPHVADSLEDAIRAARAFLGDVNAASERFDSATAELARLETQAPAAAGPKPGPVVNHLVVSHVPTPFELSRQRVANVNAAFDRVRA